MDIKKILEFFIFSGEEDKEIREIADDFVFPDGDKKHKNNIKYLLVSGGLFILSLYCCYDAVFANQTYVYKHFDITGMGQFIEIIMALVLLTAAIISLKNSIKAREDGVDFSFNKKMCIAFIVLILLSVGSFAVLRGLEEGSAKKLESDIETRAEIIEKEKFSKNTTKSNKQSSISNESAEVLSYGLADIEYQESDKYYNRKQDILAEMYGSPTIVRYSVLLIFNHSDSHRLLRTNEQEYYAPFFVCLIASVIGGVFYGGTLLFKDKTKSYYEDKNEKYYENKNGETGE